MKNLFIDLETFSSEPIEKTGFYKYVQSSDFEILLMAYSLNGEPAQIIDLAQGEKIPDWLHQAIESPEYVKHAYNAPFEWYCLSKYFGKLLPINQWHDTMLHGLYCGYPAGLDAIGKALGLPEDKRKLSIGKALIRYFCIPCKTTKTNGGRTRNLPKHDTDKWELFKEYCIGDVVTEMEIEKRLATFPIPDDVQKQWETDLRINSRGVAADLELVHGALNIANYSRNELMSEAMKLTGLENPNSVSQLSKWLESQTGEEISNLRKDTVAQMLDCQIVTGKAARVLKIRQELGKTSTKKYNAIESAICADNRIRGLLQFYGANRSGRWAGRLVQVQNLPRTYIDFSLLPLAREIVKKNDTEKLELLYGSINNTLSQLIRTAFIAEEGKILIDADFSSIEARVVAWLAGEHWKIKAFREGKDIYCETASAMFGVPVEKHGANSELRQKGKIAELACIAEGELVLTNKGLVPIEEITLEHKLWDGEEWITHEGVVYKGVKEVITYDGLKATPNHYVWVEGKSQPMQFYLAASQGKRLLTVDENSSPRITCHHQKVKVYDILNAGKRHRFTVSGKLVHNCGYGGSVGALISMGALDMGIAEEDLPDIVDKWRQANQQIVNLWYRVERAAISTIQKGLLTSVNGLIFSRELDIENNLDFLTIQLPSGRKLYYVHPELDINQWDRPSITYYGINQTTKQWEQVSTFGGKLVENCLSGKTLVLTQKGWIALEKVSSSDKVWDGEQWVSNEGLLNQGIQEVIEIDGVRMTPNHKIYTEVGWQNASKCKRYNRYQVKLPDGFGICRYRWKKITLEDSLRLWQRNNNVRFRIFKRKTKILRLYEIKTHWKSPYNTRSFKAPFISCVALNERTLFSANISSMEKLWRTRYQSLQTLAGKIREFLGRYVSNISAWTNFRPHRCKRRLLSRKLPMDITERTISQQTYQSISRYTLWNYDNRRSIRKVRYWRNNTDLPDRTRLPKRYVVHKTRHYEQVYDLKNTGPNNCFTVLGNAGPMLVHNCVQAISRDCLALAIERLEMAGYPIVFHVHDEVVIECPKNNADLDKVVEIMTSPISWAEDLPLNADGWVGDFYRKD